MHKTCREIAEPLSVVKASQPAHYKDAGELILQYQTYIDSMRFEECIAGDIVQEIRRLEEIYPANEGGVFLAYSGSRALGCIALEKQAEGIAEIRRLYVGNEGRGQGVGKKLINRAVEEAQKIGYNRVRLDTFRAIDFASRIYREAGFKEIAPYCDLPPDKVIFMEIVL